MRLPRRRPLAAGISLVAVLALSTGAGAEAARASSRDAAPSAVAAAESASYPFARANPDAVDPWGALMRQCTSYASWSLAHAGVSLGGGAELAGPDATVRLGDATHWDAGAAAAGFRVSRTPVVGAVAQWHAGERSTWRVAGGYAWLQAGPTGHVGIVAKVLPGGEALIKDFNGPHSLAFAEYVGKAPRYLVITPVG